LDEDAILEAIRAHAAEAAEALAAIQTGLGDDKPLTADSIAAAADLLERDHAELWLDELKDRGLILAFVSALLARGVAIDDEALADPDGDISIDELAAFLPRAKAFRCRVLKNGHVAGSGVLVGPSLVLTAWHVIAVNAPGQPQEPAPQLAILLSDDSKQTAQVPARFESKCGDAEYDRIAPKKDADVVDRNDVALLAMAEPAAKHLAYVSLTTPAPAPRSRSRVVLVHFPEGDDRGIEFGFTRKIRNVTARWRHDVPTAGGSSGGACFNKELQMLGIHQGEFDDTARFVPLDRFVDRVLDFVRVDTAPTSLWSLDGTTAGPLVVGRSLFFDAISEAGEASSRVRGVRIKRRAIDAGSPGLAFSHDILEQLLTRRGPNHRLIRVTQDEIVPDLVADIRRRVRLKGLAVPDPPDEPGVAPGSAPPETTAKDRAANLAGAVEALAADDGSIIWFFFDNPTITLSESSRLAFEGFVDAALVQPHLRLVITGFETLPLPGQEFGGASPSEVDRSPGLVVEFIGGFRRSDLVDLLTEASQDLTHTAATPGVIENAVDVAVLNLQNFNGVYADELLPTVSEKLRPQLELFRAAGGGG
jgi:V8-like Glu-specific endopeptidase